MLSFIFEYGASLCDAVLVVWFVTRFTGKSFDFRKNPFWFPAIWIIFAYTVISDMFLSGFNTLSTFIFLALYIAYALISAWDEKPRAFFGAISFEVMLVLLSSLLYFVSSFAFAGFDTLMQGSETYFRYIYLLLHKVLLFTFCKVLIIAFGRDKRLSMGNSVLTASFSVLTIAGLAAAMTVSTRTSDRATQIAAFVITAIFVVSNIFLYFLVSKIIKLQESKFRLELIQSKLDFEKETYENAKVVWDEARELRHDIKQHLTVIDGYLREGSYGECRGYVSGLLSDSARPENAVIRSDNKAIDYIINSKFGKRKDIDLRVTGVIGDISDIEEQDLVSLLGNLIDNAVEAVDRCDRKTIELIFFMQNSDRCIICKNSVSAPVLATNRELKTTKQDGKRHGLGTTIIRKIVEKYNGMIDYYEEEPPAGRLFCAQILLPSNAED